MNKDSSPLISDQSPSYERASEAFLHPTPPGAADAVALLARLSEAEENMTQACLQQSKRIEEATLAVCLREEASAHASARDALGVQIAAMGGSAPRADECRQILTPASDASAPDGSLATMRNELAALYKEAAQSPLLDETQRAALDEIRAVR